MQHKTARVREREGERESAATAQMSPKEQQPCLLSSTRAHTRARCHTNYALHPPHTNATQQREHHQSELPAAAGGSPHRFSETQSWEPAER